MYIAFTTDENTKKEKDVDTITLSSFNPAVPLLSIIFIYSSGPITKFEHLGSTFDFPVGKLNW